MITACRMRLSPPAAQGRLLRAATAVSVCLLFIALLACTPAGPSRAVSHNADLADLLLIADHFERLAAVADLLAGMSADEAEAALDRLNARPSPAGDHALTMLWERFGELAGPGAIAKARTSAQAGERRQEAELQALRGWARTDPSGAWQWAADPQRAPRDAYGPGRDPYLPAIAATLLRDGDRDWLIEHFVDLEETTLKPPVAVTIGHFFIRYAPERVLEIAGRLPLGRARTDLLKIHVLSRANHGFHAAAEWARAREMPERGELLGTVIQEWRRRGDLDALYAWLLELEPVTGLDYSLRLIIEQGAPREVAARLVFKIQSEWVRDETLPWLANRFLGEDPEAAAVWSTKIQRSGMRMGQLDTVFNHWKSVDIEAARRFVRSSAGLTEEERERYERALQDPRRQIRSWQP